MSVQKRRLGRSELMVPVVGLGCMSLSGVYGDADDAESAALIHHALDLGINYLDSSDIYGWGHNEGVVGRAIRGRRDEVVLATKFGQVQVAGAPNGVCGRPDYVHEACEASLKRLGVEVIDLYYQHRVDPAVPIDRGHGRRDGALGRAGQGARSRPLRGQARGTIRRAHAVHPIARRYRPNIRSCTGPRPRRCGS